ncbi:MAG: ribosomal biogenesis protein [Methanobacteriaceae archaeon]|nr:ribosomal biogenesis protein [Methanobacteriaceae archaeon]MDP3033524.1 ribosomal biogenesis protein [Methanobacteriaceae archaeon]MDP3622346.1 ribosomal biogenesis protein [Methanobacteriaceae archaeon]
MLITTSRKPSKRTRSFCQYLNRVFISEYTNRGKMSMRDVLLKAANLGYSYLAVVFEYNGNPSKITFFNKDGLEIISMTINVALPEKRINIQKEDLSFKCDLEEMAILGDILQLKTANDFESEADKNELDIEDFPESNLINIKNSKSNDSKQDYKAILDVFDKKGISTGFKIFIKNFKLENSSKD